MQLTFWQSFSNEETLFGFRPKKSILVFGDLSLVGTTLHFSSDLVQRLRLFIKISHSNPIFKGANANLLSIFIIQTYLEQQLKPKVQVQVE